MKKLIAIMLLALPMAAIAQNVWEKPKEDVVEKKAEKEKKPNKDEKYLRGAVPVVDGQVQWTLDVDVPGKSAQ
jgi:colicin import membrane protein